MGTRLHAVCRQTKWLGWLLLFLLLPAARLGAQEPSAETEPKIESISIRSAPWRKPIRRCGTRC